MLYRLTFTALLMLTLVYSTAWHALASMPESSLQLDPVTLWRTSGVDGDAGYYIVQARDGFEASIAPYKYRVLPTLAVRLIHAATGKSYEWCYVLFNALCLILTGMLFTEYLIRFHKFAYSVALLGGVLAVTTVGIQGMMLLPMLEPASYLAAIAVWWTVKAHNPIAFAITSVLAALVKEAFIVSTPVWIMAEIMHSRATPTGVRSGQDDYVG